jgi:hypothetical protein
MTVAAPRGDLVVLVADLDTESAIRGLLSRPDALGIRRIESRIFRHPGRDPGCRAQSHEYLRSFCNQYAHALVIFDLEGSGRDQSPRGDLEREIERLLSSNGWDSRAAVLVIDPEIEVWIWSDSPHVTEICGWSGKLPKIDEWLKSNGYFSRGSSKPHPPKKAFREALRQVRKQPSAAIFLQIAQRVSLSRCSDPAFQKLKSLLQSWFPATAEQSHLPN